MSKLNIAIIGLGRAGQFHLRSLRIASGLRLLHVADPQTKLAQDVARNYGCQWSRDAQKALEDPAVNAVIIATPTETHFPYIQSALNAGKAVFTEKPLGVNLQEIDQCYSLASTLGLPLFLGFMRRFDPTYANLARDVHNGAVGQLQIIRSTSRDSPLPSMDYIRTSHGIFQDCIVHDLDMIRFVAREDPVEVFAMGSNFIQEIKDLDDLDTVLVSLKFPSGLLANIDVSRKSVYGYDQRVEVFGDGGMMQAENRSLTSTVHSTAEGLRRAPIDHSFPTRYREAYLKELELFRDCVVHENPVPITHEDARCNFILADAAERSYREGGPVQVGA